MPTMFSGAAPLHITNVPTSPKHVFAKSKTEAKADSVQSSCVWETGATFGQTLTVPSVPC